MVNRQHVILAFLREHLAEVCDLQRMQPAFSTRSAFARFLCDHYALRDPKGRLQTASCLVSLRVLEQEGHLQLPVSRRRNVGISPVPESPPVLPPVDSLAQVASDLDELQVDLVEDAAGRRLWKCLMYHEHPFGYKGMVGRQLRYLVRWRGVVLAAAGFASAALQLKDRDAWIGWSARERREHLDKVLCLSRFLVRPGVQCPNLASKTLALLAERVGSDFSRQYGYGPLLLESFVECAEHNGSSLRAAGWLRVGQTAGRGRADVHKRADKSIKDIYLLVLESDFRERLGLRTPKALRALDPAEDIEQAQWAQAEFGEAPLGDQRLSRRLVSIVESKSRFPGLPFLQAVDGQAAQVAGYYRFVDQPVETKVHMDSILSVHRRRTLQRVQKQPEVLIVHDTTDLNYSTLLACEGLGVIGKTPNNTRTGGLRLHSSYALSAAEGLPLGLLDWKCYAPELQPARKDVDRRNIPVQQKETYRWIENYRICTEKLEAVGNHTRIVHVMDREGDFFDLFAAWRDKGKGELIVRAKHDRRTMSKASSHEKNPSPSLFTQLRSLDPMTEIDVQIPRKSARRKGNDTIAARPKRTARMQLRWKNVQLYPPAHGCCQGQAPVDLYMLHACEADQGEGQKAIEWFLLCSHPIRDRHDAQRTLSHYAKRWRIEDWHRILKTCCRVEEPAHEDAQCLKRLIAINMVIAWRIHLMTLLGRETPDLPMELLFSDDEKDAIDMVCDENQWQAPNTLGEAVMVVARLGGYMMRKHDLPPGTEVLWRGYKEISTISRVMAWHKKKKRSPD